MDEFSAHRHQTTHVNLKHPEGSEISLQVSPAGLYGFETAGHLPVPTELTHASVAEAPISPLGQRREYGQAATSTEGEGALLRQPEEDQTHHRTDKSAITDARLQDASFLPPYAEEWRRSSRQRLPAFLREISKTMPSGRHSDAFTKFIPHDRDDVRDMINRRMFDGKLRWIDRKSFHSSVRKAFNDAIRRTPSRVLPFIKLPAAMIPEGTPSKVRMSVYTGFRPSDSSLEDPTLDGKSLLNFWGVPEGSWSGARKFVRYYGTAYLDDEDIIHVNLFLRRLNNRMARVSAHLRA